MKTRILVAMLAFTLSWPASSHAFALLKYTFDAVNNQLGFDRGPVPKVLEVPARPGPFVPGALTPVRIPPGGHTIYIQAEGF